ncbi:acyl-CoA reductase [Rathayibacter toxicus]|uniref:acyl-CoA reductase n=1 Tax=Rathayibacter toxicus TaxID=145458 RepID=UPI001C03FF46|nr:acyl-CoA reductase [Rathayibacter toxicus]
MDIPIIINGSSRYPSEEFPNHTLQFESGATGRIPVFRRDDLREIQKEASAIDAELAKLTTADIITFLGEVGERWDGRQLAGRRFVGTNAHIFTQFSEVMMERDYETIGHFLAQRWHAYDQIESEFGDQRIFDEWIPVQMTHRRAFPRGLVLHYLVGNLPLASLYSICRGMITKNRTLAKLPSRDPISAVGLAMALQEVDPRHPVTRALNIVYWPHNDEVGDEAMSKIDSASVWGGAAAVTSVRTKIGVNVPLAEYGPRWSATAIDLDRGDVSEAAMRVVEDASFYDQEACFNTQRVFVKGDVGALVDKIRHFQEVFAGNLPFVSINRDILANRSLALGEAEFRGFQVHASEHSAVVVLPPGELDVPHPLSRTIFVHPVSDLADVAKFLNRDTQTVSVYPWSIVEEFRDEWAQAGAERLVDSGFSRMPRAGFTHDAMLGMHSMVRLVCVERPWSDPGRYYTRRTDVSRHYLIERYERVRKTLEANAPSLVPGVTTDRAEIEP